MKKSIQILVLLIIVICGFQSCTKEVFVEIPDNDPKLVVFSYLSPSRDSIQITVSRSVPLNHVIDYEESLIVSDAVVELRAENADWVRLLFHEGEDVYRISRNDFPVEQGRKYFLRVSANSFKTVESSIVIPFYSDINLSFLKVENSSGNGENSIKYFLKFQDVGGVPNYYGFQAWVNMYYGESGNTGVAKQDLYMDGFSWVMSDYVFDGKEKVIAFSSYYFGDGNIGDTLFVKVLQTDSHFYHFHSSLESFGYSDGNPFAEPSPIYTNIQNGLGCFAGYSERVYAFPVAR
ncbi:MAG: DUF4249 domain-containing protein [Bacteroidales bacterium]|nr:DUF4249 domain-containing protein [Bacteroidales bacterium]MDY0216939.1 DUF4249 domain-containing protein [Bacteroidales bacterium]